MPKKDRHQEIVEEEMKNPAYARAYREAAERFNMALLVAKMRQGAGLTQRELARGIGTTQSVIARLEDANYHGHSLTMLKRIADYCGARLKVSVEIPERRAEGRGGKEKRVVAEVYV